MLDPRIKEYLSQVGICKIPEMDTALLSAFGEEEGARHVERMMELFDRSEERLIYGAKDTSYLYRQDALVDYMNQSLEMSLLGSSFYDRVFFRRAMDYLLRYESFWRGDILDHGCGNGILTCFLAWMHPESSVTGVDLSANAVSVAGELARRLQVDNVRFGGRQAAERERYNVLFSCRTVHENIACIPLCRESQRSVLSAEEQIKRHEEYTKILSVFIKPKGYLISVERYEDDEAYAGLVGALIRSGFCQVKGSHMQLSCKNGDETAVFQAAVFQKML